MFTKYIEYLVKFIKDEVKRSGAKGVIFGLSGGIDSSVMASLIKKAFPENHRALIMPCDSNPQDALDAIKVAKSFDIKTKTVDITPIWKLLINQTGVKNKMSNANVKSRLRMTTLYNVAAELDYLVVGTSNRDEIHVGFFTKWGDGASDLLPLGNISKMGIFKLAEELNIPHQIIEKKPSAGLFNNQEDEKEMGVTYQDIDIFLSGGIVSKSIVHKIEKMHHASIHKIKSIPKAKSFLNFEN